MSISPRSVPSPEKTTNPDWNDWIKECSLHIRENIIDTTRCTNKNEIDKMMTFLIRFKDDL